MRTLKNNMQTNVSGTLYPMDTFYVYSEITSYTILLFFSHFVFFLTYEARGKHSTDLCIFAEHLPTDLQ